MGAPVGNTCPTINNGIKTVDDAIVSLKHLFNNFKKLTLYEIEDTIESVYLELEDIESIFETIRNANSDLRDWGTSLENRVEELEYENSELVNQNDEMREELKHKILGL